MIGPTARLFPSELRSSSFETSILYGSWTALMYSKSELPVVEFLNLNCGSVALAC